MSFFFYDQRFSCSDFLFQLVGHLTTGTSYTLWLLDLKCCKGASVRGDVAVALCRSPISHTWAFAGFHRTLE